MIRALPYVLSDEPCTRTHAQTCTCVCPVTFPQKLREHYLIRCVGQITIIIIIVINIIITTIITTIIIIIIVIIIIIIVIIIIIIFIIVIIITLSDVLGKAARSKHSDTCRRSLLASVMDLKKKVCSCTPLIPKVLLMLPTPSTRMSYSILKQHSSMPASAGKQATMDFFSGSISLATASKYLPCGQLQNVSWGRCCKYHVMTCVRMV